MRHEFSFFGFSCSLTTLTVAFQAPTVVRHHVYIPSPLVPSFHFDVLVKAFLMFFAHIIQALWEIVQVCMQKMNFQTHTTFKRFKTSQHVFYNALIVRSFGVAKILRYLLERKAFFHIVLSFFSQGL